MNENPEKTESEPLKEEPMEVHHHPHLEPHNK